MMEDAFKIRDIGMLILIIILRHNDVQSTQVSQIMKYDNIKTIWTVSIIYILLLHQKDVSMTSKWDQPTIQITLVYIIMTG